MVSIGPLENRHLEADLKRIFGPGAAVAVPTEKDKACAWTNSGKHRKIQDEAKVRAKDLSIDPPWGG